MNRTGLILTTTLLCVTSAQSAPHFKQPLTMLERKLVGQWEGGPCEGDWSFAPDGTYRVRNYSPGGNKLTGTWKVRWNALPPTLVLLCKTSDDPESLKIGQKTEVKVLRLDDDLLAFQYLSQYQQPGGHTDHFERVKASR